MHPLVYLRVTGTTCRKLLYVTPELIGTQGFLNTLYSLRNNNKLAMFVVDEVRSCPLTNAFLSKALTCSCSRPTRSPSGDMTSGSPTVSFQSSRSASTAPRCAVRSLRRTPMGNSLSGLTLYAAALQPSRQQQQTGTFLLIIAIIIVLLVGE